MSDYYSPDPAKVAQWDARREAEEDAAERDNESLCLDCGEIMECCECNLAEDCGRWINGKLGKYCSMAGTEFCDFECPMRGD